MKPIGLLISWATPAESMPSDARCSDCATLVGRDPGTDLALFRVEGGGLTPAVTRTLEALGHVDVRRDSRTLEPKAFEAAPAVTTIHLQRYSPYAAAVIGPLGSIIVGGLGTLAVVALWGRLFPQLAKRDRLSQ